jgi:hypothetical protein
MAAAVLPGDPIRPLPFATGLQRPIFGTETIENLPVRSQNNLPPKPPADEFEETTEKVYRIRSSEARMAPDGPIPKPPPVPIESRELRRKIPGYWEKAGRHPRFSDVKSGISR